VLHTVNDNGILTAFRPVSGEVLAQGRIRGAIDKFYASPVAADGKIFLVSESGKVAVLKTDGSLVVLALNDLEELCYATPAIADGRIYIRTRSALYCFGELPPGEAKTADRRP
jgi:outer membrane protein assembly factor BamB